MKRPCRKKDPARVPRLKGSIWRVEAKKKHPRRKKMMDIKDFSQP
jgi:hypothetical protein